MSRGKMMFKLAAIASALVLASGYVYVRAGGSLWPQREAPPSVQGAPAEDLMFFSGSKSAAIAPAFEGWEPQAPPPAVHSSVPAGDGTASSEPPAVPPGSSRSANPEPTQPPRTTGATANPPPPRREFFGGSKSMVLPPASELPFSSGSQPQAAQQRAAP
jgi:hypothetical protein